MTETARDQGFARMVGLVTANTLRFTLVTAYRYWIMWAWVVGMYAIGGFDSQFISGVFLTTYLWTIAVTLTEYDLKQPFDPDIPGRVSA